MFDIGLIVGENSTNRFVLSDHDDELEENDQAECFVRVYQQYPMKIYQLTVNKSETAGQFYKRVLQLCNANDLNTEFFVLTFNQLDSADEKIKVC